MFKITSFVIAEAAKIKKTGKEAPPPILPKSAPSYFDKSVPAQYIIGKEKIKIGKKNIELFIKTYQPDAIVIEATTEVEDVFAENILELKAGMLKACHQSATKNGAKEEPSEEYTVYQVSGYEGDPEDFIKDREEKIAGLLKSEKSILDEKEVDYTLSFQFKYSKDDLMIVDWDGAIVFDQQGDFDEDIELLQLANYQLLRYRILDEDLDERMKKISKAIQIDNIKLWRVIPSKEVTQEFRDIIKLRVQSIAQFEALERNMKLIGDWYSARLYDLMSKKFRLDGWRGTIKEKMESLEDIYSIASENLGMSNLQRLELIQIWAFFFLQIGWLVILILELFYYTK
ncbi:MAG: hypothetical protein UT05_C0001G0078 [Parcubacteria group bacterium GW2011_GWF2_38_76]|nr:MAG: hypothetical protein UT05_C0001G0078 [Parcubacteria group bacterium GW2011_GWF2_38_76]HBM45945.1 hypothetical protein [Patescibacteria group bacterium]